MSSFTMYRAGRRPLRSRVAPTESPLEKTSRAGPSHASFSDRKEDGKKERKKERKKRSTKCEPMKRNEEEKEGIEYVYTQL